MTVDGPLLWNEGRIIPNKRPQRRLTPGESLAPCLIIALAGCRQPRSSHIHVEDAGIIQHFRRPKVSLRPVLPGSIRLKSNALIRPMHEVCGGIELHALFTRVVEVIGVEVP